MSESTQIPLRIAWTGSAVGGEEDSGAAELGGILLAEMLRRGVQVDLYHPGSGTELAASLSDHPNLAVISEPANFAWDRWYSRTRITAFASGAVARIVTQIKLARRLVDNHRERPYDALFQFSQPELFFRKATLAELPPVVVHPCTTAARELHWHRRESAYALQAEPRWQHYLVRGYLRARTSVQRRGFRKPVLIAGPSENFNSLLTHDYGVPRSRTRVLRHPVNTRKFGGASRERSPADPVVLLYVARFSARKGLELIVALSHRLADLRGQVEIKLLGGPSLWSDYTAHLGELNPSIAEFVGGVPRDAMADMYASVDAVIVPSHYEPGSLVVGEALGAGRPVVASDQVGPVEVLDPRICRVFPAGDVDALELEVRALIAELRASWNGALTDVARTQASRHFGPDHIGEQLVSILEDAAHGVKVGEQPS